MEHYQLLTELINLKLSGDRVKFVGATSSGLSSLQPSLRYCFGDMFYILQFRLAIGLFSEPFSVRQILNLKFILFCPSLQAYAMYML